MRGKGQEVVEHDFPGYGGSRAAYVDDPDGNVVELWTWDVARHLGAGSPPLLQTDRDDLRRPVARLVGDRDAQPDPLALAQVRAVAPRTA